MFLSVALVSLMGISPALPEKAIDNEITKEAVAEVVFENRQEFYKTLSQDLKDQNLVMIEKAIMGLKGGHGAGVNADRVISQK